MRRKVNFLLLLPLVFYWSQNFSLAAEIRNEIELGLLQTKRNEIYGYQQENATRDWKGKIPTARFETWWLKEYGWNFGLVAQPLFVRYEAPMQANLNAKSRVFNKGEAAKLDYQFHTLRSTANYGILGDQQAYLRLGASIVARYADLNFRTASASFHDSNFLVLPLLHLESNLPLVGPLSFFSRSDFLPSPTGKLLYDGLFDVLFAVRYKTTLGSDFDLGLRLFFGGYDPDAANEYANKIFFYALVARYIW